MPLPGMMPPTGPPPAPPLSGLPGPPPMGIPPQIEAIQQLAGMRMPQRGERAALEAAQLVQVAATEASGRSAKAAEHFSRAYSEIMKGRQVLQEIATAPMPPPPNLLGTMLPMPAGQPAGPMP